MTLSFSQKINGKPNYFIDKIWHSLMIDISPIQYLGYGIKYIEAFGKKWDANKDQVPKLHTIRQGNRWKAGMLIHPVINNRTAKRFQFAPTFKCVSVQDVEISRVTIDKNNIWPKLLNFQLFKIKVDGKVLKEKELKILAINDGFDSVEDFFAYFNNDFKGQIIHWTDLKY